MGKANISLQMVVIAALCLVVLVVLSIIFTSRMADWNEGLRFCESVCKQSSDECSEAGYDMPLFWGSCEDNHGNKFKKNAFCCREKSNT